MNLPSFLACVRQIISCEGPPKVLSISERVDGKTIAVEAPDLGHTDLRKDWKLGERGTGDIDLDY